MSLKPHQCTKKLHAKLNKRCHTYFIASSTSIFFSNFPGKLMKITIVSVTHVPQQNQHGICLQQQGDSLKSRETEIQGTVHRRGKELKHLGISIGIH